MGGDMTGEDGQEASRLAAFLSALTEVHFFVLSDGAYR